MTVPELCPKCGAPRALAEVKGACPRCGLAIDRWAGFTPAEVAPHPVLDPAFEVLAERWSDPAAHETFLSLARGAGSLDGAAARYRKLLRERHDEVADQALRRVALLAAHQQASAPRDALPGARWLYWGSLTVAVVAMVALAALIWKVIPRFR